MTPLTILEATTNSNGKIDINNRRFISANCRRGKQNFRRGRECVMNFKSYRKQYSWKQNLPFAPLESYPFFVFIIPQQKLPKIKVLNESREY